MADTALDIAIKALKTISTEFADPYEISQNPEEFGGPDDGLDTVCMAYENMQGIAASALSRIDALAPGIAQPQK